MQAKHIISYVHDVKMKTCMHTDDFQKAALGISRVSACTLGEAGEICSSCFIFLHVAVLSSLSPGRQPPSCGPCAWCSPGEEVHPRGVGRLGFEADTPLYPLQDVSNLWTSPSSSFKLNGDHGTGPSVSLIRWNKDGSCRGEHPVLCSWASFPPPSCTKTPRPLALRGALPLPSCSLDGEASGCHRCTVRSGLFGVRLKIPADRQREGDS